MVSLKNSNDWEFPKVCFVDGKRDGTRLLGEVNFLTYSMKIDMITNHTWVSIFMQMLPHLPGLPTAILVLGQWFPNMCAQDSESSKNPWPTPCLRPINMQVLVASVFLKPVRQFQSTDKLGKHSLRAILGHHWMNSVSYIPWNLTDGSFLFHVLWWNVFILGCSHLKGFI